MFSLRNLSSWYDSKIFPYVAPYLLPATNTLMTCSVYSTVAVALNRFIEMSPNLSMPKSCEKGSFQNSFILIFSIIFNFSRWFELQTAFDYEERNSTFPNGSIYFFNESIIQVQPTLLRRNQTYFRIYSFGINMMIMIVFPVLIMSYSSYTIYHKMAETSMNLLSSDRNQARLRRNQIVISIYETFLMLFSGDTKQEFAPWAKGLIVINTLLVVINCSCNFVFYCGDVVFRECLSTISQSGCNNGIKENLYSMRQTKSVNNHQSLQNPNNENLKPSEFTEVRESVNYV
ncbi:unnamed protein product [Lepeophtheirus salmonis]|uniref:(salmon louse) hypothetical protein n=1 Tax=Lepeophtheirus salmonis TaxID=72036 RepID=A0A7R8CNV4_LEPSM|nr:unnamed protein product [Lepeophtheirus salmonis]CAF2875540.1 unnamed protein product [Lepeophtheirus salmonis]